ncbi:hypothetical protein Tco_1188741 [Tanacetum coccineum]
MDLKDAEYFHQLLQLQKVYRFLGFSCEPTDPWERTLPTPITLNIGRYLQLEEILNIGFLEHYFNFAAYNELSDRATARNPILTDYIGRIRAVGRIITTGHAITSRKHRRWHHNRIHSLEMAQNFNVSEYDSMEKPVIIDVSSCYINRYNAFGNFRNALLPKSKHPRNLPDQTTISTTSTHGTNPEYQPLTRRGSKKGKIQKPISVSHASLNRSTKLPSSFQALKIRLLRSLSIESSDGMQALLFGARNATLDENMGVPLAYNHFEKGFTQRLLAVR